MVPYLNTVIALLVCMLSGQLSFGMYACEAGYLSLLRIVLFWKSNVYWIASIASKLETILYVTSTKLRQKFVSYESYTATCVIAYLLSTVAI